MVAERAILSEKPDDSERAGRGVIMDGTKVKCARCDHHRRYHHDGLCTICVRWYRRFPLHNWRLHHEFTTDHVLAHRERMSHIREVIEGIGERHRIIRGYEV